MNKFGLNFKKIVTSRWLPWVLVGVTLLVALLHEILQPVWIRNISKTGQILFWTLTLLGLVLAYLVISRIIELQNQRDRAEKRLADVETLVKQTDRQLEAFIRIGQEFVEASDENEVIEPILRFLAELTGSKGISFVPLDDHGQPQTALSHGEIPFPILEAWLEYLATPGVRERCRNCEFRGDLEKPSNCPLLKEPFSDATGLLCLPVRRGEKDFGVMTLFMTDNDRLDERMKAYLIALMDETALGLEGIRLRRRELAALRQMQSLRQKADLTGLLNTLLENVHRTLETDFAILVVPRSSSQNSKISLTIGDLPDQALPFVEGVLNGVMASGQPLVLGDVAGDRASTPGVKSLMAVPMISLERNVVGGVLVANRRGGSFHQRQLALLQTISGQVALVVQNANLMAELEYKTMVQERMRLAREIHDGLAQTIGFLKLQASQLRGYLTRGETEKARQSTEVFYETLSEAYLDARQAIDDLRISPADCGLLGWLSHAANEFQEVSGLPVDIQDVNSQIDLPPEIHAQLIRILQEALSNVRKHAQASQVWIACQETGGDLVLEVRDDGEGFSPEDVNTASRHGLRGMRERAELIGADFQVISGPREGTIVRVRLPLKDLGEALV